MTFHKIHILKISFFSKFTLSKSHFSQNSHFQNLIFHKILIFKILIFPNSKTEITREFLGYLLINHCIQLVTKQKPDCQRLLPGVIMSLKHEKMLRKVFVFWLWCAHVYCDLPSQNRLWGQTGFSSTIPEISCIGLKLK